MTAQIPDRLEHDGRQFDVFEFLDLPPGVQSPPAEILVQSTACWRGYTARWAIEPRDGRLMLVMLGFQCDEYLPLCEPYVNPITGTVRAVPDGAPLLHYEHMGFQSKYAGELNLRFVAGELVGIEPIADREQPQDGLLDLAELGTGGKEGWIEQLRVERQRREAPRPVRQNAACSACGRTVATVEAQIQNPLCNFCLDRLQAVGQQLRHWKAEACELTHTVMLSDRVDGYASPLVSPEWSARSALLGIGWLSWVDGAGKVRLCVSGYRCAAIRARIEWACERDRADQIEEEAKEFVDARLVERLKEFPGAEAEVEFGTGGQPVSVSLTREIVVEARAAPYDDGARHAAEALERSLDRAVGEWRLEAAQILRRLRQWVPALIEELTEGTGIYPYRPVELTPRDRHIFDRRRLAHLRGKGRKWAVLPRHTPEGWVPGEAVWERYRKSLNV